MANYTINSVGSTTCNYPSTINVNDVLTFNVTKNVTNSSSNNTGTMLTYTFPCDCTAEILAAGAKGGDGAGYGYGGRGAIVAGTISFKTGDQLLICVGQAGTSSTLTSGSDGTTGAGGGGTYVVKKVSASSYRYTGSGTGNGWYVDPLVIAAGGNGGGDNLYSSNYTIHASSNNGNETSYTYPTDSYQMGGGFSKCAQTSDSTSGRSFLTGASGATDYYSRSGTSYAGFGGGGANADDGSYGGGGGGYTGGEPDYAATSYVIGTATGISRKSGATSGNNGQGYVKITFKTITPAHEFPADEDVVQTGFDAKVKVNNSWKDGDKGYVKVNNAWKEIKKMYTKVNNAWVLTGEEKELTIQTLLHEGFLNTKTIVGEYNGTATYSAYTAGTGVQLYVASSSYPTAVGNFKSNTEVLKDLKTITFDFQRTSGNTNFNIGIFVSSTAQSGRLNSTNTNSLIKAFKTFNTASGTVTIDLEDAFGANLNTYINSNYYIGFYLNCTASTTVVIKNAQIGKSIVPPIMVLENGTLNASTALGDYKSTSSYSKYTAGTGISLYKATSSTYPYSVGTFEGNSNILSKVKSITFDYTRTSGSGNFELGIFYVSSIKNGRLTDNSTLTYYKTKSLSSNTGTVTFNLSELGSTNNNYYLGVLFYQTGSTSNTVVIKNMSYVESDGSDIGSDTGGDSSLSNLSLRRGIYDYLGEYSYEFMTDMPYLSTDMMNLSDFINAFGYSPEITISNNSTFELSELGIIVHYYTNGAPYAGEVIQASSDHNIISDANYTSNSSFKFTFNINDLLAYFEGTPASALYISIAFTTANLNGFTLTIPSMGNMGSESSSPLQFYQGYWEGNSPSGYSEYVCTNKIDVRSISVDQGITVSITCSIALSNASIYVEAWDTSGEYIDWFDLNETFVAGRAIYLTYSKNDLVYYMEEGSAYNIGYMTVCVYSDSYNIYPYQFSGTCNIGSGSGSGLTLRQGYYSLDGEYIADTDYESIVTDKVSVKSLSNDTSFTFTVTSTALITAAVYLEVWGSDGTQGTYMKYIEMGSYSFTANQPTSITISKNEIAYDLNLSSGYDVGHVALSLYSEPIYVREFTITYSSGVTPRDDI